MTQTEITTSKIGSLLRRKLGNGQVKLQGGRRMKKGLVRVWIADTPATVWTTIDDVVAVLDEAGLSHRSRDRRSIVVFDPTLHQGDEPEVAGR